MFNVLFLCSNCSALHRRNESFDIVERWGYVLDKSWQDFPDGWSYHKETNKLLCKECSDEEDFDDGRDDCTCSVYIDKCYKCRSRPSDTT